MQEEIDLVNGSLIPLLVHKLAHITFYWMRVIFVGTNVHTVMQCNLMFFPLSLRQLLILEFKVGVSNSANKRDWNRLMRLAADQLYIAWSFGSSVLERMD